jgi:hypothetical protein
MNAPSPAQLRRAEGATWGDKPPARRPKMRLLDVRPLAGAVRGFSAIELPIGLMINSIPILIGKNGPWTSLPNKPQIGQDGRYKTDVNGKAQYTPFLWWRDRDLSDRFSTAVVELVRQGHPDALSDSP